MTKIEKCCHFALFFGDLSKNRAKRQQFPIFVVYDFFNNKVFAKQIKWLPAKRGVLKVYNKRHPKHDDFYFHRRFFGLRCWVGWEPKIK